MKLIDTLKNFKGTASISELTNKFGKLAPSFLYGGHIVIDDDYKIYIRTVEFYYHSEKTEGIHDPIMYHRNGKDIEHCPYLTLMTLHAHASGFDITFENQDEEYRASTLIRAYEVKNKDGKYLKWEKVKEDKWMFVEHDDYQYNTQSTYLYSFLNGFSMSGDNQVLWKDEPREAGTPVAGVRQNVYQSISPSEYNPFVQDDNGKDKRCDRMWSFTRNEEV